jgi:hypothetical protein
VAGLFYLLRSSDAAAQRREDRQSTFTRMLRPGDKSAPLLRNPLGVTRRRLADPQRHHIR